MKKKYSLSLNWDQKRLWTGKKPCCLSMQCILSSGLDCKCSASLISCLRGCLSCWVQTTSTHLAWAQHCMMSLEPYIFQGTVCGCARRYLCKLAFQSELESRLWTWVFAFKLMTLAQSGLFQYCTLMNSSWGPAPAVHGEPFEITACI